MSYQGTIDYNVKDAPPALVAQTGGVFLSTEEYTMSNQRNIKAAARERKRWRDTTGRKKARAGHRIRELVRAGKLERQPCEICGSHKKTVGHHDDYDKWREVRWLCYLCHARLHARPRGKCTICGKEVASQGYCNKHYKRYRKYGDPNKTKIKVGQRGFRLEEVSANVGLQRPKEPANAPD